MSAALVISPLPFEINWINSNAGNTNIRTLPPRGTRVGGTMTTKPALPITARHSRSYGIRHYEAQFDCDAPSVLASLRAAPGYKGIMGIAFTFHRTNMVGGSGYLLAGVRLTADELPPWADPLPDAMKDYISNMAAAVDSMRRLRLFGIAT